MPEEEPKLSSVVPVLAASLVCDSATSDSMTGKETLVGIFNRIGAVRFPVLQPLCFYWKLTDAEGFYRIDIRYVQVKSGTVLATISGLAQLKDRLGSADFSIQFQALPIPEPGRYEFQVWGNDVYLGASVIDASEAPTAPQPPERNSHA